MEEERQLPVGITQRHLKSFAKEDGYYAKSFNGDGFSEEMKIR